MDMCPDNRLTPIEKFARRCEIYVEEDYAPDGTTIAGVRARVRTSSRHVTDVYGPRLATPSDLGELLHALGVALGREALR